MATPEVNTKVWPDGDYMHDRCVTRRTEPITGQPGWQEIRSQHVKYRITHQRVQSYEQQEVEQQVAVKFEGLKVFTKWCNKIEETRCEPPAAAHNNHANALAGTFEPRLTLSRQWEDEMVFDFSGYFTGEIPHASFSQPLHQGHGQQPTFQSAMPPPLLPNSFLAQAPPNPFQGATSPTHFLSAAPSTQSQPAASPNHFFTPKPPHQPAPVRPSARASLPPLPPPNPPMYGNLLHQHAQQAQAQAQAQSQAQTHQPRGAHGYHHTNVFPTYPPAQHRSSISSLPFQEISDDDDDDGLFVPPRPRAPRNVYTTTDDQDSEYTPPAAKKRGKRKSKSAALAQQHTMSGGLGRRGASYED